MNSQVSVINKPAEVKVQNAYYTRSYDKKEWDDFMSQFNFVKTVTPGSKLYFSENSMSQSKIREAGFLIKRKKQDADVIIVSNPISKARDNHDDCYTFSRWDVGNLYETVDSYLTDFENELPKNYTYIYDSDLYKSIYKYTGDFELFTNISELLKSNDRNNARIAMEFMTNADWRGNEIYLQELFNLYWNNMSGNRYTTSISFKGFLKSLDFNHRYVCLDNASDYRKLCKTDEHHKFVYDKYIDIFKEELNELVKQHKVKIDKLKYSIDYGELTKDED